MHMMKAAGAVVMAVAVAIQLALPGKMAAPYNDVTAVIIDDERAAMFPGGSNGPAFPPDLSGG